MTDSDNSRTWLKPPQVDQLRDAAYADTFASYSRSRNDAIIALLYDAGLRPTELVGLTTEMFHGDTGVVRLPTSVQKDYANSNSPPPKTIELAQDEFTSDTVRTLRSYMDSRWKESQFMFPSRVSESMTTRSLRNTIKKMAVEADIEPYVGFSQRGEPTDVSPYTLRHSVAYRMLEARDDPATFDQVRKRLRHGSARTTEKHYDMFDTV